jgi:hypothetical protein
MNSQATSVTALEATSVGDCSSYLRQIGPYGILGVLQHYLPEADLAAEIASFRPATDAQGFERADRVVQISVGPSHLTGQHALIGVSDDAA